MMRINRFLASCGVGSRRAVESIILAQRIAVNGQVISSLATQIDETRDQVTMDGRPLRLTDELVYVLLNKPKGYVTTASDERGRRTVFDLIHLPQRLFPVGRLDLNTTGLLLLTNDGELAYRLTHPRFKVPKRYHAALDKPFDPDHFILLREGIMLEDGITQPCQADYIANSPDKIEIELKEGRQQQVRRMFAALGYQVNSLNRVRFGGLKLDKLRRSDWRHLTQNEVHSLRVLAGLAH